MLHSLPALLNDLEARLIAGGGPSAAPGQRALAGDHRLAHHPEEAIRSRPGSRTSSSSSTPWRLPSGLP